jgi:hypothetical protein
VCGVVGSVWYDGVSKGGFSVYGKFEACGCPVDGDVEVVQSMVCFLFSCGLHLWV